MFRLSKAIDPARTTLTIDGELSAGYVGVIETCCGQAIAEGRPVELVLNEVASIDAAGRALLARLARKGVRLLGKGIYTSYLLRNVGLDRADTPGPANRGKDVAGPCVR